MTGMDLLGARVLLTGASSGIGRALALRLGERGARLVIAARRTDLLDSLADELASAGAPAPVVVPGDLSERGAAAALAARAVRELGGVDVLINNAGGGAGGSQWAVGDGEAAREAFEINLWSPVALTSALVPAMRERRSGVVVNVTSGAPFGAIWPGFGTYAATKGALTVVTAVLRTELASSGVRVMEVLPGAIDTAVQGETRLIPGIEKVIGPRKRLGSPDAMARKVVRALERGRDFVVYPAQTRVVYWFPAAARAIVSRMAVRTFAGLEPEFREALFGMAIRTGSQGDEAARWAREEWEATRPA
jgi:short-subunit dehydrogenase